MNNKIFNWILVNLIVPIIYKFIDQFKIKKKIEDSNNKAKDLRNAKSPTDIDNAFDNLP